MDNIFEPMKIIFLNNRRLAFKEELSEADMYRFQLYLIKNNKEGIYSAQRLIELMQFFYKLDVNEYGLSDIQLEQDQITINLKDSDLAKMRNSKLNQLGI